MREYLILLCLCLGGCTAKPVLRSVNDAAAILCRGAPGAESEARVRGVSVEELCSMRDVLGPFIDEALMAQKTGARKAGMPTPVPQ